MPGSGASGRAAAPVQQRRREQRPQRARRPAAAPGDAADAAAAAAPARAASPEQTEEARFHEAYAKASGAAPPFPRSPHAARTGAGYSGPAAYTVSQLYNVNRPPPVPLSEYEQRRKRRDLEDILAAAKKAGKSQDDVRAGVDQLEKLLPDVVNLNRMRASDWVQLAIDVNGVAAKLILLKTLYPSADAFSMVTARPKTLLQSEEAIREDAAAVKKLLTGAKDVCAIVEAVPELIDATQLTRSLAWLRSAFPTLDAVELLQENPLILRNIGESNAEDSAEYGEMTTKD
ncbi:hypothetical protein Rsub_13241 [Raphidocelis subcapitata]|uniref:Uncharacterized protein n=1 Tax=Raphidocelis subcapitata TaxID=307507 RepID=A0A2V0PSF2_9CHLO|nr:hypothetical protein Rsub_13241 [Raphidocelis subcapitata]|eukprot:GBG00538.1 hypothetical protein Rsub_13241 [Raphidocelis subcapitata]